MSKFVPTKLGIFRYWTDDHGGKGFLFLCPICGEWLPMAEETLSARKPIDHEHKQEGRFCSYSGIKEFGKYLVSTMQARRLMAGDGEDIKPYVETEQEARNECRDVYGIQP